MTEATEATTAAEPRADTGTVAEANAPKKRSQSQATMLVELATEGGVQLWHTPDNEPFVTLVVDTHREHHKLRSVEFRRWLARRYYDATGGAAGSQAVQDALAVLAGMAIFEGTQHPVFVRVAAHGDAFYVDLANPTWQAIKITASGWEVVDAPPCHFKRARGTLPLPTPQPGGSLANLRQFINLGSDADFALLVAFLVACLRPTGPYPVLVLTGEQGSSKSTLARVLKALIDPSTAPLRSGPKDGRDLMVAAANAWLLAFDNFSHISGWMSDALCRLSTGGAFATRELYSDDSEVLFDATRPMVLTSIEDVATRADLLDRAIVLTLQPIRDDERKPESELWSQFEKVRPLILGALLDAASCAMKNLPHTRIARLPRLADFALWAVAAEPALGVKSGEFLRAYTANRVDATNTALENPLAQQLIAFIDGQDTEDWAGTASELLAELNALAGYDDISKKRPPKEWPSTARSLSGILRRLAPNLRSGAKLSLDFDRREGREGRRTIGITSTRKAAQNTVSIVSPVSDVRGSAQYADNADARASHSPGVASVPSADTSASVRKFSGADGTDGAVGTFPTYSNSNDEPDLVLVHCPKRPGLCADCMTVCAGATPYNGNGLEDDDDVPF